MKKSAEEIFDECAKKGMIRYQLNSFKRVFPTLFRVIMDAMEKYHNQK